MDIEGYLHVEHLSFSWIVTTIIRLIKCLMIKT